MCCENADQISRWLRCQQLSWLVMHRIFDSQLCCRDALLRRRIPVLCTTVIINKRSILDYSPCTAAHRLERHAPDLRDFEKVNGRRLLPCTERENSKIGSTRIQKRSPRRLLVLIGPRVLSFASGGDVAKALSPDTYNSLSVTMSIIGAVWLSILCPSRRIRKAKAGVFHLGHEKCMRRIRCCCRSRTTEASLWWQRSWRHPIVYRHSHQTRLHAETATM